MMLEAGDTSHLLAASLHCCPSVRSSGPPAGRRPDGANFAAAPLDSRLSAFDSRLPVPSDPEISEHFQTGRRDARLLALRSPGGAQVVVTHRP